MPVIHHIYSIEHVAKPGGHLFIVIYFKGLVRTSTARFRANRLGAPSALAGHDGRPRYYAHTRKVVSHDAQMRSPTIRKEIDTTQGVLVPSGKAKARLRNRA
jgi:hypothetical protein